MRTLVSSDARSNIAVPMAAAAAGALAATILLFACGRSLRRDWRSPTNNPPKTRSVVTAQIAEFLREVKLLFSEVARRASVLTQTPRRDLR